MTDKLRELVAKWYEGYEREKKSPHRSDKSSNVAKFGGTDERV